MAINNTKYAQLQPFQLYGNGAVAGEVTITLQTMLDIDGNALSMSGTFGTLGFGTLQPGAPTYEEQICFTGLTNNANGTVTLTGVSSVTFEYPYTQTSGLMKTHAGATTFVISNTSGFYGQIASKNDDATITGRYIFPSDDISNAGIVADTDTAVATAFVTLGQLSRQAISGASNASTTVKGIVQLPTQAQVDAKTTTGSTSALLALTPDKQRSTLLSDYVVDTGAADAYVITPVPAISAYATGQIFTWKATHTNTTTSTLNVNGKGATTIKKVDGATNLIAGDIVSGQLIQVEYDGTNFQMLNPLGNAPVYLSAGAYPAGNGAAITGLVPYPLVNATLSGSTLASSTTETALYTVSIPGGSLKTTNALRCKLFFTAFEITNTKTCTLRLKYGSTTLATLVVTYAGMPSQAFAGVGYIEAYLFANASASAQTGYMYLTFNNLSQTTGNITYSEVAPTNSGNALVTGTATETSSGALNFVITAQFNNNSSVDAITTNFAVLDKVAST